MDILAGLLFGVLFFGLLGWVPIPFLWMAGVSFLFLTPYTLLWFVCFLILLIFVGALMS